MKEERNWVDTLENIKKGGLLAYLSYAVRVGYLDDYPEAVDYLELEMLKWLETQEMYEEAHYMLGQIKIVRASYREKAGL